MSRLAIQIRSWHRSSALLAALLAALLLALATIAFAITRSDAGAGRFGSTPVAACAWRHHGWFC